MIVGVFLKNIKIYKKTRFVPITTRHRLTAFVGPNGAGKSSILEALDTYFNNADWIVNKVARRKGETTNFINLPYVAPVMVILKEEFEEALVASQVTLNKSAVEAASDFFWNASRTSLPSFPDGDRFLAHRDTMREEHDPELYYLVVAGVRFSTERNRPYFGPFHQQSSFHTSLGLQPPSGGSTQLEQSKAMDLQLADHVGNLNSVIHTLYDYIYIPSDVSIASYTRLETSNMQLLMGRDINEEIRKAIPQTTLNQVNASLEKTIDASVDGLPLYTYEKPKGGKKNITHHSLSRLVTREFFSIRELARMDDTGVATPVSHLSSGEQRRALLDLASNYLTRKATHHRNTILAIDEPEISLHTALCYDQFETLFGVARLGVQCLLTTHWYGFLPIAQDGNAHFIQNDAAQVEIDSYDLSNYKEQSSIKQGRSRGAMPFDVSLKSANDLVQSIASSLRAADPYSWILCEGSSESIYLGHMLRPEVERGRLRIVPLGGAGQVLKVYRYLDVALSDKTFAPTGKVLALIDTDVELLKFDDSKSPPNLSFRRLLLPDGGELRLVPVGSTLVSPATDIERCLNAAIYRKVLESCGDEVGVDLAARAAPTAVVSGHAYDLLATEALTLREYFKREEVKTKFARRYVQLSESEPGSVEPLAELLRTELGYGSE